MRRALLCAAVMAAFAGVSGAAAMPKTGKPAIASPVESAVCVGNRRDYRSFNHCVRINRPRFAGYCSRICH